MGDRQSGAAGQHALWNGHSGRVWVDAQAVTDQMFRPFEVLLADAVGEQEARRVLDVGCGTGATTLAVARRLGGDARCVGVDVSAPMLAAARERAREAGADVAFVCADVQRHDFEPAGFDTILSRFGVMFFDDPVAAFANLRRAATADARLIFAAWRGPEDNPFMTLAERTARPWLPDMPARVPGAPGQFGFADRERVVAILAESGWREIEIVPVDLDCTLPERELHDYLIGFGPVGQALQHADASLRARIGAAARCAYESYVRCEDVHFRAACWMVRARA
ncbi:class I SAM-dependent methyltransferase [Burkholderia sp. FERM BP-3421]|jgi:SAM-dependent methyltransferase|uniref:class I SAM-dependent methyltransferase n=1 Tax=Burkholderia sp. FERM BP-3421 TaxID=1494466 RepID=UPI002360A2A3|nr:class I SAM-dependent methyltransferase [Burkholderia sp. FERM BP-3421]WDD91247.1 class I SAM-dependent methyltransferase [Burkholderia sp. FERM BP-3421]